MEPRAARASPSAEARTEGALWELVQMDGSFHEWLEGRGPRGCLMNMVDDATGTTLCRMGEEETIWAAVGVLKGWIGRYGVPKALYTDWKNVYVREQNAGERQRGEEPVTQFGRMCQRLGIQIIAASSPQAKGRVERNHGTHQDRLVKKLRRRQTRSLEEVNGYLEKEYCSEHNRRFAVAAASKEDYHLPDPGAKAMRAYCRWRLSERSATIGWCDMPIVSIKSSDRASTMHRRRARCWCASGKIERWRFSTVGRS